MIKPKPKLKPKTSNKSALGTNCEQIALDYLIAQGGIHLVTKNFASKYGEIDLICLQNNCICFIEVRYRRNCNYGYPEETVNYYKQKRIIYTAKYYLLTNPRLANCYQPRFDIIAITGSAQPYTLQWYQNAFPSI